MTDKELIDDFTQKHIALETKLKYTPNDDDKIQLLDEFLRECERFRIAYPTAASDKDVVDKGNQAHRNWTRLTNNKAGRENQAFTKKLTQALIKSVDRDTSHFVDKPAQAKYYALLHHILINLGKEKIIELNENDKLPKKEIKRIARERYQTSDEMFYRSYREIDLTNWKAIKNSFDKGFEDIIIKISNNNEEVIRYFKEKE